MPHAYCLVHTCLGWVGVMWGGQGLVRLCLPQPTEEAARRSLGVSGTGGDSPAPLGDLPQRLRRYFAGEAVSFPDRVDLSAGTPFQQAVWRALREIPPGTTVSYGQLARRLGRPRAARAVGQAMAANPLPIVLPCHRVVASDGRLGGFSGADLGLKAALLRLEAQASVGSAEPVREKAPSPSTLASPASSSGQ